MGSRPALTRAQTRTTLLPTPGTRWGAGVPDCAPAAVVLAEDLERDLIERARARHARAEALLQRIRLTLDGEG